jgi:hypothetical protein
MSNRLATRQPGRGFGRSLVVGVAALLIVVVAAPGVRAARSVRADPCPFAGTLCLFEGANYTGARFTASSTAPGGTCVSLNDHGWGDRARSAINTNSRSAAMFMNDDCVGGPFQVPGNGRLPSFGSFTPESVWVPAMF